MGGRPSKGTPADRRLKDNKAGGMPKPHPARPQKGKGK